MLLYLAKPLLTTSLFAALMMVWQDNEDLWCQLDDVKLWSTSSGVHHNGYRGCSLLSHHHFSATCVHDSWQTRSAVCQLLLLG